MSILNDEEIYYLSSPKYNDRSPRMITPYEEELVRVTSLGEKVISYGSSSFGYDMRLDRILMTPKLYTLRGLSRDQDPEILMINDQGFPTNYLYNRTIIDPKAPQPELWDSVHDVFTPYEISPGRMVLGSSIEYWRIPTDIAVSVIGKSTYARSGIIINVTPMEPGWEGHLTIEIHNASLCPVIIYPGEGIAQAIFHRGSPPRVNYADRQGKYQSATGIGLPTA